MRPISSRRWALGSVLLVLPAMIVSACGTTPLTLAPTGDPMPVAAPTVAAESLPAPSIPAEASPTPLDMLAARTAAKWSLEGAPDMPTEAFGSIWIIAPDQELGHVHRIDPTTDEIVASIAVPDRCQSMGATPEGIWVCTVDGLTRIDPETNALADTIPARLATAFHRMPYGAGSLWAFGTTAFAPDVVLRVDPSTGTVMQIPLGHTAGSMAFGLDALWVTSPTDDLLLRIDPTTNEVETWVEGLDGAGTVSVAEHGVWVALHADPDASVELDAPAVARVDPGSRSVVASIAIGDGQHVGESGAITATDDAVWVRASEPFLARIDPATNEVVDRIDAGKGGGEVLIAFGSVWASSYEFNAIWRIEP